MLPPSELPPAQARLVLPPVDVTKTPKQHVHLVKPDGGSATTWKLCSKFKHGSKNWDSALMLGRSIAKLEADPDARDRFTALLKRNAAPPAYSSPNRGIHFNKLNIPNMKPEIIATAMTERLHEHFSHISEVSHRAKTHRAAKVKKNEIEVWTKQARIDAIRLAKINEKQTRRNQLGLFAIALFGRTHCLIQALDKDRANRECQARQLAAARKIQKQIRQWVLYRVQERMNAAALTIIRYIRRHQIRKLIRNKRRAAGAIIAFCIHQKASGDTSYQIRRVLASARLAQRAIRCQQAMWQARATIHYTQWVRAEPEALRELRHMRGIKEPSDLAEKMAQEEAGQLFELPRAVRRAVVSKYVVEARSLHCTKRVEFARAKDHFLKFKTGEAQEHLEELSTVGAVAFDMDMWAFIERHEPELWATAPRRPIYKFALGEAQMEELILDGVALCEDIQSGRTTLEQYVVGSIKFHPEDCSSRGTTGRQGLGDNQEENSDEGIGAKANIPDLPAGEEETCNLPGVVKAQKSMEQFV